MKRYILILTVMLAGCFTAQAQRCLPGQTGVDLSGGFVNGFKAKEKDGQGFYGNLGMSTYNKKGNRWVFGGEYLRREFAYRGQWLPVEQITAEGGHYVKLLSDPAKTFFLSAGASALLGYEILNESKSVLYDGARLTAGDGFIYGGALSLEIETYLTDRIVLLVRARERVMFGSSIGKFHFQFGAGIRFMIK